MELTIASLLRALVAEHGADVVGLERQLALETIIEERAHHRGGAFRAQGEALAAAIGEHVHLFFDDVGGFAHGAGEQLGLFEDGSAEFAVIVLMEHAAHGLFEELPAGGLNGEDVTGSTDRLNHEKSLKS
ncbi:hypothetical protein MAIT1_01161 [Magnetofaba australis IT-1]|uniref:Uncharacterized protein n=1 Tax=Magnetofaba australis IT-1 TaxID=1434232 RepID=A0A1Y2K7I6_9PROT|nr:hypothetical protein MAIT1_01161 [Magnetofaba australis IT-1]